ncbi:hypothetical protein KIW84_011072 [Lathyrus oleraceus]|uniref:SET domain-containing protein n=1 Tax=Pisum sativum TaxID=3888 RepID=A0A9D4YNK4_PEA|nr:hypothetical protein KIW84_011072 [Pisum sativum]
MNGELRLPCSEKFSLPPPVPCPGGRGEAYYCSMLCAGADWESSNSLLCTVESSDPRRREALLKFMKHANETNDIFLLAAKTIIISIFFWKLGDLYQWDTKRAIFDKECEPLFSLEIYGHIIGMFELNHLDLVVASPVEIYFLYIDEMTNPNKEEAEKITQPILDALGEDYSTCCEGTAFFPLQSCMNHSCCPNAKAFKRDEDRDGQATIIALLVLFSCEGPKPSKT